MALEASGAMSLGGATVGRSVNCELGCSGTAAICMDRADVRGLAEVPSGAISMNCFYGKSSGPTLGGEYEGGYYIGTYYSSFYLILSPIASGCVYGCKWKTTTTFTTGTTSNDGYTNTYSHLNNATHPAGNWTATRSINGYSDWYLPSKNEMENQIVPNYTSIPAGQGFGEENYWLSTEGGSSSGAYVWALEDDPLGELDTRVSKLATNITTRAVRRSAI